MAAAHAAAMEVDRAAEKRTEPGGGKAAQVTAEPGKSIPSHILSLFFSLSLWIAGAAVQTRWHAAAACRRV
jgi:hypothetical protein